MRKKKEPRQKTIDVTEGTGHYQGGPKKIDHEKTIKLREQGLTCSQIAKLQGCNKSVIVRVLQRYGTVQGEVEEYKNHRADIFAAEQDRLLKSITDEARNKMPPYQRYVSVGILYDKERLERGRATNIREGFDLVLVRIEQKINDNVRGRPVKEIEAGNNDKSTGTEPGTGP